MSHISRILFCSLFSLFFFQSVQAKTVTVTFKGTIDTVGGTSTFSPGQVVEGTYAFDDATPNTTPVPDHSEYRVIGPLPADTGFTSLTVGAETFTPSTYTEEATIFVANDIQDWNGVYATIDDVGLTVCCQAGTLSGGLKVDNIYLAFNDGTNNPLDTNYLPSALSALPLFEKKFLGIHGSDNSGGWYNIQVKIDTVTIDGATPGATGPKNLVAFDTVITDFSGPYTTFNEFLRPGKNITGNFTFDPALIDNDPNPDAAEYITFGDDNNHIKLNLGGETFTSNTDYEFKIAIRNYPPEVAGPDTYLLEIHRVGSEIPLANGLIVDNVRIEFVNGPAQNLSGTDLLSSTPSELSVWYIANMTINGRHQTGSPFSLRAALSDLAQGQETIAPMATEELFPASGTTQMGQRFDALAFLNETRAPIVNLYSRLHNAAGQQSVNCGTDNYTMTGKTRIICHYISDRLLPGMNVMRIAVHFADGTKKYYLTRWNVIE